MNAAAHLPARLGAYYFAYFTYAGALVPYFSLWLAAQGYGAAQIALVLAMPQLARVFAPSLWGWLADHTGRQREIVVFGAFAVFAGFAALYAVRGAAGGGPRRRALGRRAQARRGARFFRRLHVHGGGARRDVCLLFDLP